MNFLHILPNEVVELIISYTIQNDKFALLQTNSVLYQLVVPILYRKILISIDSSIYTKNYTVLHLKKESGSYLYKDYTRYFKNNRNLGYVQEINVPNLAGYIIESDNSLSNLLTYLNCSCEGLRKITVPFKFNLFTEIRPELQTLQLNTSEIDHIDAIQDLTELSVSIDDYNVDIGKLSRLINHNPHLTKLYLQSNDLYGIRSNFLARLSGSLKNLALSSLSIGLYHDDIPIHQQMNSLNFINLEQLDELDIKLICNKKCDCVRSFLGTMNKSSASLTKLSIYTTLDPKSVGPITEGLNLSKFEFTNGAYHKSYFDYSPLLGHLKSQEIKEISLPQILLNWKQLCNCLDCKLCWYLNDSFISLEDPYEQKKEDDMDMDEDIEDDGVIEFSVPSSQNIIKCSNSSVSLYQLNSNRDYRRQFNNSGLTTPIPSHSSMSTPHLSRNSSGILSNNSTIFPYSSSLTSIDTESVPSEHDYSLAKFNEILYHLASSRTKNYNSLHLDVLYINNYKSMIFKEVQNSFGFDKSNYLQILKILIHSIRHQVLTFNSSKVELNGLIFVKNESNWVELLTGEHILARH